MSKQSLIENYISAYNRFDVEGMAKDLHEAVRFRNIAGGEVNLETSGIAAFKEQANRAIPLFREREQRITGIQEHGNQVEVSIAYSAVLATDLSEKLKAGDTIQLQGKSIFQFKEDKIISIEDIS